jgi:hypothetical protein
MTNLPPTPRPLTATARRRSWAEMPVRIWCVLAVAMAVVAVYVTIDKVISSESERQLILNGIAVDAVAVQVNGTTNPEAAFHRNETLPAKVHYLVPGEETAAAVPGTLSIVGEPGAVIHPGDHLPLRIDPADRNHWTDRTQPRSWFVELSVVILLLPLLLVLLAIASLQRARILRIWREGDVAEATVVEIRQTAIAPLSRLLRFSMNDGSTSRLSSVLVPTRAGVPARGETISLVMPRGVPQRAVMGKLYVERNSNDETRNSNQ